MATSEEELNIRKLINQELDKEKQKQSESLDLSSSLVDSIKEVLGINTKRTTADSNLLKVNKQINAQILNQKTDLTDIASINKEIAKNTEIINKGKVTEASLENTISKEAKNKVDRATKAFTIAQNAQKELEVALTTTNEQGKLDQQAITDAISKEAKASSIAEKIMDSARGLEKQLIFTKLNTAELENQNAERKKELALEEKIEEKLGLLGQATTGVSKGLEKAGFGGLSQKLGIDDALKSTKSMVREQGGNVSKMKVAGNLAKNLGKNLMKSLGPVALIAMAIEQIIKAFQGLDKMSGELAKNLGVSYGEAQAVVEEMNDFATSSEGVLVSTKELVTAQQSINSLMGTNLAISGKMAGEFALIQKRTGLSGDAMAFFQKTAFMTGKPLKSQLQSVSDITTELNQQTGLNISNKQIQEDVAKSSKSTLANFGGSVKELAKAAFQARALGTNLDTVSKISSSLLDFESSIQNEMQAELLLGKDINLEKARAFALSGEEGKLAEEIGKQKAIMNAFETKNVMAQEAAAKAIGLSREELGKMVTEQKALEGIKAAGFSSTSEAQKAFNQLVEDGMSFEQARSEMKLKGLDDSLTKQMESESKAEKMARMQEKIGDLFMQIASALMPLVDILMSVLDPIMKILNPIFKVLGAITEIYVAILEPMLEALMEPIDYMMEAFSDIGSMFEDILPEGMELGDIFKDIGNTIGKYYSIFIVPITAGIKFMIDRVKGLFSMFAGLIKIFQGDFIGGFKMIAEGAIGLITSPFQLLLDTVMGIVNKVIGLFGGEGFEIPDLASGVEDMVGLENGGTVKSSGAFVVGEAGPEIVNLNAGSSVIPNDQAFGNTSTSSNNTTLVAKIDQLISINRQILSKSTVFKVNDQIMAEATTNQQIKVDRLLQ